MDGCKLWVSPFGAHSVGAVVTVSHVSRYTGLGTDSAFPCFSTKILTQIFGVLNGRAKRVNPFLFLFEDVAEAVRGAALLGACVSYAACRCIHTVDAAVVVVIAGGVVYVCVGVLVVPQSSSSITCFGTAKCVNEPLTRHQMYSRVGIESMASMAVKRCLHAWRPS